MAAKSGGLEGIVVADTRLSDVDGEGGHLVIAGRDVEALAGTVRFEEVCALLWESERSEVEKRLGEARVAAFATLPQLGSALDAPNGMDAVRAALAHISSPNDAPDGVSEAAKLTGAMAVFVSAWTRTRSGKSKIAPDPSLSHAADTLRMVIGDSPPPAAARELDAYLVTVSDHGMNASTFAARVVASTGSDMASSVVAALGALKGPLHGGAPGPVLDMLDAVGSPEGAAGWVQGELEAGRRIMGMGHRVYRVRDPRAAVLESAISRLLQEGVSRKKLDLARAVERAAETALAARHPDRPLKANVEFFTAVLLDAVGLDRAVFTPMFAVGRVAGWCAHYLEQRATGRLIRPAARYVGPRAA